MVAELELDSELETHLRMFEWGRGRWPTSTGQRWTPRSCSTGYVAWTRWTGRHPARRSGALSEVKTRGLAEQHGCRTAAAFLRQLLNCSAAEAGARFALADDLVPGRSMTSGE